MNYDVGVVKRRRIIAPAEAYYANTGAGSVPFAIDGTPATNVSASSATLTATLNTTYANDLLVVAYLSNGAPGISVASSGLTWTSRASAFNGVDKCVEIWTATAPSPLSGHVITATATTAAFISMVACAISGANTASPMDANGSNPTIVASGTGDPTSISTSTAVDVIFGAFRSGASDPTEGAGFTLTGSPTGGFLLLEHKFVISTQSSLSITMGTGVGTSLQSAAVAFKGA